MSIPTFPTDPRRPNADQSELLETLSHISEVIGKNEFDSILWAGDINADFVRNSNHTNTVNDLVEDLGLSKSWDRFLIDFTCYHELLGVSHVSTLDHFFWSEQLGDNVVEAGVLHLPDNKSDHCLIYCIVNIPDIMKEVCEEAQKKPRPNWSKAKLDEKVLYKTELEDRISNIIIPDSLTSCRDVKCRNSRI